jgi:prepilin-type N-terminal cleavage/methylation domain-containing protein
MPVGAKILSISGPSEGGVSLIEMLVALAILGSVAVAFLSGLATTSKVDVIDDEQATAESLARSQMEWLRDVDYVYEATEYPPATLPEDEDYINYSVTVAAEPLHDPDDGIQKIAVTVKRLDKEIVTLEDYKIDK